MTQERKPETEFALRRASWEQYRNEMGDFPEEFYPAAHRAFSIGHQRGHAAGIASTEAFKEGYYTAAAVYEVPSGIPSPEEMRQAWWAAYTKSIRNRRGSHPTTAAEAKGAKESGVAAVIALIQSSNGMS